MTAVLGIDAAWSTTNASGVALVKREGPRWRCLAVAPSYQAFTALSDGQAVNWTVRAPGGIADMDALMAAAAALAGQAVEVVAVDMPLACVPITGRRQADTAVSKAFGAQKCATHSPSIERPGSVSESMTEWAKSAGFQLATECTTPGAGRHLVEVYPHPALLNLMKRPERIKYKAAKMRAYWITETPARRRILLESELQAVADALAGVFDDVEVHLPKPRPGAKLADLKRYEDAIDALVCCWVGSRFAEGDAYPLGDDTAAIWLPGRPGGAPERLPGAPDTALVPSLP